MYQKVFGKVVFRATWPWVATGVTLGLGIRDKYFALYLLWVGFEIEW